jgi:shikimate dehydrogenase
MKYAGLIGYPVAHSLSPRMHCAAFEALGIAARYELWETPANELKSRVESLRAPEMLGANVTIPHKEAVLPLLDAIDPLAKRIGAVNTIVQRGGRLVGYNTDAPGFLRAVSEQWSSAFELSTKRAILLGNGGAARGAAVALLDNHVDELTILGRETEHVEALLKHLRQQHGQNLSGAVLGTAQARTYLARADLVVNTTSVGLKPGDETRLLDVEVLPISTLVMDMIFNPPQTLLLREAQAHGCTVLNGLSMLLYQGSLALELWLGQCAPVDVMRAALNL